MAARLLEDPPRLACWFSTGKSAVFDLPTTDNPELVHDLVQGLLQLIHPHGKIDAEGTVSECLRAIRLFVTGMSERGHHGGAANLVRPPLVEQWWQTEHLHESYVRRMLAALDRETEVLNPLVGELARGRLFNQKRRKDHRPLPPYDEQSWAALRATCERDVDAAWAAFRQARASAELGCDPIRDGHWSAPNLCWWLSRNGPTTSVDLGRLAGRGSKYSNQHIKIHAPRRALFPDTSTVIAYRLLFGILTGIVPDGIADLGLDDLEWTGDGAMLVDYVKGRTTQESVAISPRAVRLLERWLEHSALLREFAPPEHRGCLWLRLEYTGGGPWQTGPIQSTTIQSWVRHHALDGPDGKPLKIHRHRIRTSFESHRDRKNWFGSTRGRIDPNHSARIEGDRYLSSATPAQITALETIVEGAQGDLLRKAQPPTVLSYEQLVDLAEQFPELVAELGLDDAAIAELCGGERDVFAAACSDPLSGQHGPKGKPCPARPWVCLLCPLALFAPRHAANLLRLKAFFARQWQQMPAAQFMAVFGLYAQRIEQVLAGYDAARLEYLAARISDHDDELPLLAEEYTG